MNRRLGLESPGAEGEDRGMTRILHHDLIRAEGSHPDRWMLVAAGIFGAGRNWASVARRFVKARPDWGCIAVDLRQHGDSMGFSPPHTLAACAGDLLALGDHLGLGIGAILGHSFGGKVALAFADLAGRSAAAPLLEAVWVVDSTPASREPGGSAWRMLEVLRGHPGPFPDRAAGVAAVESAGFPRPVALWMSTNLVRWSEVDPGVARRWLDRRGPGAPPEADALVWRLDPDDMEALLRSFFDTELWSVVEHPSPGSRVNVIRARESTILDEAAVARIEAAGLATGAAHLYTVDGGHWVNADNPEALQRLLVAEMP